MARLIDLGEEDEVDQEAELAASAEDATQTDDRPNPNIGLFSAALSCYP